MTDKTIIEHRINETALNTALPPVSLEEECVATGQDRQDHDIEIAYLRDAIENKLLPDNQLQCFRSRLAMIEA